MGQEEKRKDRKKFRVRTKVEWPSRILKQIFKHTKVRYCGVKKNQEWLQAAFALIYLYQHRKRRKPPQTGRERCLARWLRYTDRRSEWGSAVNSIDFTPRLEWVALRVTCPEPPRIPLTQTAATPPVSASGKGLSPTSRPGPASSKRT